MDSEQHSCGFNFEACPLLLCYGVGRGHCLLATNPCLSDGCRSLNQVRWLGGRSQYCYWRPGRHLSRDRERRLTVSHDLVRRPSCTSDRLLAPPLQESSVEAVVQFATGGENKAFLSEREFLVVMHLIYVAHREAGGAGNSPSYGSDSHSARERFTCAIFDA